ncbi:MAG TPA: LemA family protein [Planctomycetota bacterium]|nr:LemA family protein [Planctomycetota bacterium]
MEFIIPVLVVLGIVVVLPIVVVALMYNHLVSLRNRVTESWSNVDTELKRRYDLIPNLVETVKGYAAHERAVFERVVEARARAVASNGRPAEQAADENQLVGSMKSLFAVAERYPDLQASRNFLALQEELTDTEDRIQAARRFYNGNVRDYNNSCQSVPTNLIAGMFNFQKADFFEIESAVMRQAPKVGLGPA